jgi:hypothetical protein
MKMSIMSVRSSGLSRPEHKIDQTDEIDERDQLYAD